MVFYRTRSATKSSASQDIVKHEDEDMETDGCEELNEVIHSQEIKSDESYNRKFIVCKESVLSSDGAILHLKHPKSGSKALYFLSKADTFEVLKFDDGKRSFFFGESVISDGTITMLSPIHPLFLVIPYLLNNAKQRFAPLDQILVDENTPAIGKLEENEVLMKTLPKVTDSKELCDTHMYRYNEKLLLRWLETKFDVLNKSLLEHGTLHSTITDDETVMRRYTYGILTDFLPDDIANLLKSHLNIQEPEMNTFTSATKRKADEMDDDEENYTPPPATKKLPPPKISTKAKQLQQASKGTKSLTSFFSPKA